MGFVAWVGIQIEWFKSIFSEPDGKASHRRVAASAIVWVFLVAFMRKIMSEPTTAIIPDIPENWLWLIVGVLGLGTMDAWLRKKYIDGPEAKAKIEANGNGNSTPTP